MQAGKNSLAQVYVQCGLSGTGGSAGVPAVPSLPAERGVRGLCGLLSAEGTLLPAMEQAPSRPGEKPKQIGKVSSATYLNKLFIGYV